MSDTPGPYAHAHNGTLHQHTPEPCGCVVNIDRDHPGGWLAIIDYCPTHDAAPDLLAALEDCASQLEWADQELGQGQSCGEVALEARAAIAKAKGES